MEKTIEIPEGYEARIEGNKVILEPKESEDERIRKALIQHIKYKVSVISGWRKEELIAWLEKQGSQNLANSEKTCKDEQNPAWSEEDEEIINNIGEYLNRYGNYIVESNEEKAGDVYKSADWLKSLKFRVHPQRKPSEEQMHYLSWVANIKLGDGVVEQEVSKHLNELLNDLKKLKG